MQLILASTSPYRRKLLSRLQLNFTTAAPDVDEHDYKKLELSPQELAERLAQEKAKSVQGTFPEAAILGSDQVVALGDEILGKPGTEALAVAQLKSMAGKEHELITSVVLRQGNREWLHTDVTRLWMRSLNEAAIRRYVRADQPTDCAGSYKIESLGISLFEKIETADASAIEGLPLLAVCRMLRDLGVELP